MKKKEVKMTMTDEEIYRSWRDAASPTKQLSVLKDLNCCGLQDIVDALVRYGVPREDIKWIGGHRTKSAEPNQKKTAAGEAPAPTTDKPDSVPETPDSSASASEFPNDLAISPDEPIIPEKNGLDADILEATLFALLRVDSEYDKKVQELQEQLTALERELAEAISTRDKIEAAVDYFIKH